MIDSNVPGWWYGDRSNTSFVQFYNMYPTKIMGTMHIFSQNYTWTIYHFIKSFHWHVTVKSQCGAITNVSGLTHKKYVVAFCFAASKFCHIAPCYIISPSCTSEESISITCFSHVYLSNVVSIFPMPMFLNINPFPVVSQKLQLLMINNKNHMFVEIQN